jgi:hypothetical protein
MTGDDELGDQSPPDIARRASDKDAPLTTVHP